MNQVSRPRLIVPDNDPGWTDQSFNEVVNFLMANINLADAVDMLTWFRSHIQAGPGWLYNHFVSSNNGPGAYLLKRPTLNQFRWVPPSALLEAYESLTFAPRPCRELRNAMYRAEGVVVIIVIVGFALLFIGAVLGGM